MTDVPVTEVWYNKLRRDEMDLIMLERAEWQCNLDLYNEFLINYEKYCEDNEIIMHDGDDPRLACFEFLGITN